MEQICNKCGKTVSGVVRVSEPQDLYTILEIGVLRVFMKKVKLISTNASDSLYKI